MKILIALPRFPYPLDKGDKLRAYHQIVELSKRHQIYLFCVSHTKVSDSQLEALRPYCKDIHIERLCLPVCWMNTIGNWFRSKSLQMGYWNTTASKKHYREYEEKVDPDVVYNQMVRTMPLTARSKRKKVMDFQDALSLNAERRMDQTRGLTHYLLHYEFKMLRSSEYNAFSFYDGLTIISETDSDAIPHKRNGGIRIVRNGVDFDYFSSQAVKAEGRYSIAFCGNMSYAPNVDAARYLVEEVMPIVWAARPEATVLIAGADPKAAVRRLASEQVSVSGRMDDIRQAYASSKVFVAPMRIGSGLQNKLLEAMSMGLPCVTTPLVNAALGAESGNHLLCAERTEEIAEHIIDLLGSQNLRETIAAGGHQFVHDNYSWAAAVKPLEDLLNEQLES